MLETFQSFRTILCICPHCGGMHRLSDLHLSYKGKAPQTWLDSFEKKQVSVLAKTEKFEEKEGELRKEAAERGRKKVPKLVCRSMEPCFSKLNLNPYDIKLLTHPVDFVVFNGLNDGKMANIMLLSKITASPQLNAVRGEVKKAVEAGTYDWQVARVDLDGKITYE